MLDIFFEPFQLFRSEATQAPAFRSKTLTSPTKCTPLLSKLYQPAPCVALP